MAPARKAWTRGPALRYHETPLLVLVLASELWPKRMVCDPARPPQKQFRKKISRADRDNEVRAVPKQKRKVGRCGADRSAPAVAPCPRRQPCPRRRARWRTANTAPVLPSPGAAARARAAGRRGSPAGSGARKVLEVWPKTLKRERRMKHLHHSYITAACSSRQGW